MNKYRLVLIICSTIVSLDQLSKYLVRQEIPLYSKIDIFPFLDFSHIRNTGVAFGMLQDLPQGLKLPFFIVVFAAAVIVIFTILKNLKEDDKKLITGLSLIMAGAIGNSIDRFRLGYVTDFIDFYWQNHHWPPFNIADSSITIGAIMVILAGFFSRDKN